MVVHGLHGSGVVCNILLVRPAMVAYALDACPAGGCMQHVLRALVPSFHCNVAAAVVNNRNDCSLLQVARSAQLVATIEEPYHLPGGDSRWFLD